MAPEVLLSPMSSNRYAHFANTTTCVVVCATLRDMDISIKFTNEKIHFMNVPLYERGKKNITHKPKWWVKYTKPMLLFFFTVKTNKTANFSFQTKVRQQFFYEFSQQFIILFAPTSMARNVSNEQKKWIWNNVWWVLPGFQVLM